MINRPPRWERFLSVFRSRHVLSLEERVAFLEKENRQLYQRLSVGAGFRQADMPTPEYGPRAVPTPRGAALPSSTPRKDPGMELQKQAKQRALEAAKKLEDNYKKNMDEARKKVRLQLKKQGGVK